ncbi:MAG: glycosyltransferase family 2 protein [Methylococcaceae bacterium]
METHIVVSIVIVSWNAKDYLEECLSSLNRDVCNFPMEIIVVDNASSDGSTHMVQDKFPHVKLIKNAENLGFAKANNIGIRESTGNYIALVNSDVHVLSNCISSLVDYCELHPDIGMVGPRIIGRDGQQQRSCRGFPGLWNMLCRALALDNIFPKCKLFGSYFLSYWNHNSCTNVDILSGCFWLVRKKALDDVGLLDEMFFIYGEDMDWCKRFWAKGWPIAFYPDAEAVHYGGASSSNAPVRFFIEKQRADLQYWEKHHSRLAVKCYFVISCVHHGLRILGYLIVLCLGREKARTSLYKMQRALAGLKWMFTGRLKVPELL